MTNLDELRKKAEAATQGPWAFSIDNFGRYKVDSSLICICDESGQPTKTDSEFIAAANPAVVLELIAEIERLKSDLEDAEAEARNLLGEWHEK